MTILNRAAFETFTLESECPVLVVFLSPWCFYCRRLTLIMEKIARKYQDSVLVGQVDTDKERLLAQEEQIEILPTVVLYHRGKALGALAAPDTGSEIEDLIRNFLQEM